MKTILHRASSRGHASHDWLDTYHTFSFASYYNPERVHFGSLRVLNDDTVAPGMGFGMHPHENMEIITIPLEGALEHKDSMGNTAVIRAGEIQVMSAGTGILHSEYNKHSDREVKFLQIWVFPDQEDVEPRYDQISTRDFEKEDSFFQVLSPDRNDQGVWIHQDAWFHLGSFREGSEAVYDLKKEGNGVYAFIIDGKVEMEGETLGTRDGYGIWETDRIRMKAIEGSTVLLMEFPMTP